MRRRTARVCSGLATIVLWFAAFGAAPTAVLAQGDETTTTGGTGAGDLPSCPEQLADLDLASTLDFADVARPFAGDDAAVARYELSCPYGDLPAGASADSVAPLTLVLGWAVAEPSDLGCADAPEVDASDQAGVVPSAERQAQVDWAVTDDGPSAAEAEAAATTLLDSVPGDAQACAAGGGGGGTASEGESGGGDTSTALAVIGGAAVVAAIAGLVLLLRRRRADERTSPPVPPAAEPAGGGATRRELLLGPPDADLAPAPPAPPGHVAAGVPPAAAPAAPSLGGATLARELGRTPPAFRASSVAALALVAAAGAELAARDRARLDAHRARGEPAPGGPRLEALAESLESLTREVAALARADARSGPSVEGARRALPLVDAARRLLDAHRPPSPSP